MLATLTLLIVVTPASLAARAMAVASEPSAIAVSSVVVIACPRSVASATASSVTSSPGIERSKLIALLSASSARRASARRRALEHVIGPMYDAG